MNTPATQSNTLSSLLHGLWAHRQLIVQMTKREVLGRYKGSVMGLLWSFLNPVFMLVIYTFVFSVVFKARWGVSEEETKAQFAIILFVGLIMHGLLAEVLNRAPSLILSNVNYVKKVVFPLEILPVVAMGSALFHTVASLIVLFMAMLVLHSGIPWTAVFLPLILVPLILIVLGLAWFLASLGVFLRDVGQTIGLLTTVLMFVSPIFFPITAIPEPFRPFMMANPLTFIVEQARAVLIWGNTPDWGGLVVYSTAALGAAWLGYVWFQRTRKGFADVI